MASLRSRIADVALGSLGIKRAVYRGANAQIPGAPGRGGYSALGFNTWDMTKALRHGYQINEWVHACVAARAQHAASVPWRVSEFADKETKAFFAWELKGVPASQRADFFKDRHRKMLRFNNRPGAPVERKRHMMPRPNDPLEQLLERPNPRMTREVMVERMMQHMMLGGNGLWVKLRAKVLGVPGNKTPFELWPLFPQATEVERDGMVPRKYHYRPEGRGVNPKTERSYDPEDVIHHAMVDPSDPIWGMSPLMAAAKGVDMDVQAATWQLNSFDHRAIPDMIVAVNEELKPKEYEEYRRQVAEQHQGVRHSRAPWVLGNQARIQQLSLTPQEMDFIKTRGMNRQSICTVFKVFPAVIAVMEGVTLANMETVLKHHWIQTVIPDLNSLMSLINLVLTPEFGDLRYAWFDTANVDALTTALIERVRAQKILHTEGAPLSILNDAFELGLDLEGVPLADEPIFPAGVITGTQLLNGENVAGNGNTDTPPEGGPVSEPGDPQDINDPDPADVVPDDPGDNPDTLLTHPFSNGNSDPHLGVRRWNYEQALSWLQDETESYVDPELAMRTSDHFEFREVRADWSQIEAMAADEESGVTIEEGAEDVIVRFYHGDEVQRRREDLVARVKRWGFSVR